MKDISMVMTGIGVKRFLMNISKSFRLKNKAHLCLMTIVLFLYKLQTFYESRKQCS